MEGSLECGGTRNKRTGGDGKLGKLGNHTRECTFPKERKGKAT